jgi:hypothetical protein
LPRSRTLRVDVSGVQAARFDRRDVPLDLPGQALRVDHAAGLVQQGADAGRQHAFAQEIDETVIDKSVDRLAVLLARQGVHHLVEVLPGPARLRVRQAGGVERLFPVVNSAEFDRQGQAEDPALVILAGLQGAGPEIILAKAASSINGFRSRK